MKTKLENDVPFIFMLYFICHFEKKKMLIQMLNILETDE